MGFLSSNTSIACSFLLPLIIVVAGKASFNGILENHNFLVRFFHVHIQKPQMLITVQYKQEILVQ